jgi:NAD(P)H dehydrogenase (quinone)
VNKAWDYDVYQRKDKHFIMILITGATGHFGKATIDFLIQKGVNPNTISALARSAEKAKELINKGINVKIGDYEDYPSLVAAFAGVEKLLLISSNDLEHRVRQHTNVVNAAKEAGVKHIIYTSFVRRNETASSPIAFIAQQHIESERLIKESGISYTFMFNALYADSLLMFMGENVVETGIFLPAGNGKGSFTARIDMAEAAANLLLAQKLDKSEYIIANTLNYSMNDLASILTELSGKPVAYLNPSKEVYLDAVTKAGMPEMYAHMFANFSQAIEQGEFETSATDLETILGRKPLSLKEFLKSVYSKS